VLLAASRAVMMAGGRVRQGFGTVDIGIKKMMAVSRIIMLDYYKNGGMYI
jgi:hypothetical protein